MNPMARPIIINRIAGFVGLRAALVPRKAERVEDAMTWEDFLLMKLAHMLAAEIKAELFYEDATEPTLIEPQRFATIWHNVVRCWNLRMIWSKR
jgi:hypothetical protein